MPMLVYVLVQHGRMDMFSWNGVLASALLVFPFLSTTSLTNAPSWSIGVELVCYLLFPFLIVIWRLFGPHSFGARLVAAMTILALLYVKLAIIPQYSTSIDGIGAVLRGLVGFVLGMALWRLRDNLGVGFAPSPARLTSGEISSLAGMGLAVYLDQPQWVVIFAASLLFCLSFDAGRVARALRARWCLWLGHISFSVYLLHYPLIVMFNQWFPARMLPVHGGIGRTVWTLGVIAALLGLSTLTFRYIEVPARRIPHRLARRRASSVIDRMPLERLSS
jgi:peptidoglycan/LPS O-acetylase OafA/YrhL